MSPLYKASASSSSSVTDPVRGSSKLKTYSYDPAMNGNVSGQAMVSGTIHLSRLPVFSLTALTGLIIPSVVQGVYTADTNNLVGLYTSDASDVLTRVAQSADVGDMWKGVGGTATDRAFSSPYTPASTDVVLYGAYLYRSSAQTTAPTLPRMSFAAALTDIGGVLGNRRSGSITGQTSLPATLSGVTFSGGSGQSLFWMGAY